MFKFTINQWWECELTLALEFGVPGVAVPPGIFESLTPWPVLPFVIDVLNVVTADCTATKIKRKKKKIKKQKEFIK